MGSCRALLLGLAVAVALSGCAKKKAGQPLARPAGPRHVVLQTDWFPQAEHGGFYQALAKGFYREAGLDVEIRPGGPRASIKVPVSRGEADFGINRSDDLLVFAARGLPLVMVAAVFQHDPQALMVHESSPVKTLRDLAGRTVTANVGMTWIPYVQKELGIAFALKPNPYNLTEFFADKGVIQQCLVTNEPFIARQRGVQVRTVSVAEPDCDSYHTIFCRRALVKEEPEVVRAFVAASLRGWHDYLDGNPQPANDLIMAQNRDMSREFLEFSRGEMILRKLVDGDPAVGERAGDLSLGRIGKQIDVLLKLKVLETPVALNDVATREFLPPAQR